VVRGRGVDDLDARQIDDGVPRLFADDALEQPLHHLGRAGAVDDPDDGQAQHLVPHLDHGRGQRADGGALTLDHFELVAQVSLRAKSLRRVRGHARGAADLSVGAAQGHVPGLELHARRRRRQRPAFLAGERMPESVDDVRVMVLEHLERRDAEQLARLHAEERQSPLAHRVSAVAIDGPEPERGNGHGAEH
jgi:hypothetical protein